MKIFVADDLPEVDCLGDLDAESVTFSTNELGDGETYYVSFQRHPDGPQTWEYIQPKIAARFRRRKEMIEEAKCS